MNPVLRRFIKFALILAGILLAMLIFVWQVLPGIVQSQAEKFIAEKTGHRLSLARPEIDPLALSLRLRELRLVDAAGAPLLAFGELLVDLSAASLTRRSWVFDEIRVDGLNASLIQLREGGLNWSPLLAALQGEPPAEPRGLPRVDIRQLRVADAQLHLTDRRLTPAFATRVEPLDLELDEVSTLPDDAGRFKLGAKTAFGARLAWSGEITLNPLASHGRIDVNDIDLERLGPWLRDKLPLAPPAGRAAFGADYRLSQAGARLDLSLEKIALAVSALRLQKTAGAGQPQLAVDRVELTQGHFDLATRQLALGAIQLRGTRVETAADGKERAAPIKLDGIVLSDAKVDLARRRASLAALSVDGGHIELRRDAQGRIDLRGLIDGFGTGSVPKSAPQPAPLPALKAAPKDAARPATDSAPWRFRIEHLAARGLGLVARDETVAPAVELALDNIAVAVAGLSENLATALPLKASLDVKSGGRLELAGNVTPATAAADLQLTLGNLALKPAQPYLAQFAALDLASGQLSASGRVTHGAAGSGYRGDFALRDLRLNQAGSAELFLAWKSLSSKALELGPRRLDVALLSLDGLDSTLIIAADKTTNLKRVLRRRAAVTGPRSGSPGTQSEPAPTPAAAPAAPQFQVNIDRLRFRNGELDFADNSLLLPFATRIHGLRGSIVGLSSRPGAPGQVELDGEVDEFGLARAVGQLDLFEPAAFMDLRVIFRNVEMTRLTPYSATFAGRKIDSGKLSLDLEYKIRQRQLHSENQVVMDRLVLGEKVASPNAKDLPLDLAIAILSDADGRIELGLPVSGSLDDPQFSYGQLVWKALGNLVGRIISAPFRALGALFGGGGEKLDAIAFEPGAARLTPPEREKLLRLATALNQRPGLALNVSGTWSEADRLALQDLQLRRALATSGDQTSGGKGDPGPLSTRNAKTQAALESLFADRFGGSELAALKDGFRSANPGQLEENLAGRMLSRLTGLIGEKRSLSAAEIGQLKGADFHAVLFERLRVKEVVADAALHALAVRRGDYALEQLKAAGAPVERIRQGGAAQSEAAGRDTLLKLDLGKAGD